MGTYKMIQRISFFIIMFVILPLQAMNYFPQSPIDFCQQDDLAGLKNCIEVEKQDINQIRGHTTALVVAVKKKNVEMVQYLLQQGACVDTFLGESSYGTAFIWAV